jgi:hypothetical protein
LLSSSFEKTGTTPKVLLFWAPPYLKNIHVLLYQGCTSLERTHNNLKRKIPIDQNMQPSPPNPLSKALNNCLRCI